MGWFDEQIRNRSLSDQEMFEESVLTMAQTILGTGTGKNLKDEHRITKEAIDEVLKYYHFKPVEVPDKIKEPEEQLETCLRPYGIMHRIVDLSEGWQHQAYGPMIGYYKEGHKAVALLPHPLHGYWFKDENGEKRRVNRKTEDLFEDEAICFYRPLPLRSLTVQDLMTYMKRCLDMSDFVMFIALTLLVVLTGMMVTHITRFLTGFVLGNKSGTLLLGTALFLVCVQISTQLLATSKEVAMKRLEGKVSISLEAAVMSRLMSLPAPFFKKFSSGELSSRAESINELGPLLVANVFSLGVTSLVSLLYITQIFRYAPGLVVPAMLVIIVTTGMALITSFFQAHVNRQGMEARAKESGISYALISGIQKIKLAGAEKRAFARWAESYAESAEPTYNPPLFLKINGAVMTAISLAGTLALYYFAVMTQVSPSEYISFSVAYGQVFGAFRAITDIAMSAAQIKPILEMAKPLLDAKPEAAQEREMVASLSGGIELNHVMFRYNESLPYVVNDMSLQIKPGEYIAIVGRTGCGKSTLMRLLLGFETPEKGAIYYDKKDLTKLDLPSLRRRIGTVTQDGGLFEGDIFSNITLSAPQLTLDEAWEAAEMAGIADDIRQMPMGMNTVLGEGQGGISGGQRQRLMIARAIAPKPKILMFDEATSALDNITQRQVTDALAGLKCTRLVIAHRLSTIKNCDRILVLDKGRIMEEGTYEQLIEKGGLFAELVARQRLDTSAASEGEQV